jgi:hypothetical protein
VSSEEEREWGFAPPNGGEWPSEVQRVAGLIINSLGDGRLAAIMAVAYEIHRYEGGPDPEVDYQRQRGQVDVLTGLIHRYMGDLLPGGDYGPAEWAAEHLEARGVAGYLLQHASDLHRKSGRPPT